MFLMSVSIQLQSFCMTLLYFILCCMLLLMTLRMSKTSYLFTESDVSIFTTECISESYYLCTVVIINELFFIKTC